MKRVRMLLRVSSNQQLEADGDLTVQRQIVREYICRQTDWQLDEKEYFEGGVSGYQNSVKERDVLQEALQDAGRGEYDILAAYKDDRIGRRMWEIGAYVMQLKNCGVDIYTVKDGCISPEGDDIMGQMMLALRYGNAQKSSADTSARVKDTARKLVQKGKFMGGCAPYGYKLELSGEISKHGRALHELVILPEQAEAVKYMYELSLCKEYGSKKIAQVLNEDERFKNLAPKTVWKSGTVTSILTNPVYTGHMAYQRRERIGGRYHRLEYEDWITSIAVNEKIRIMDDETWNRTQEKRKQRRDKYRKKEVYKEENIIGRNAGMLALIDVTYCGYCKGRLVNGSKYNYWTIKGTGEKKAGKIPVYKCRNAWQGMPHKEEKQYRADQIEPIVFGILAEYIDRMLEKEDLFSEITHSYEEEKKRNERDLQKKEQKLTDIRKKIAVLKDNIPNAMTGEYLLTLEELTEIIKKQKLYEKEISEWICEKKEMSKNRPASGCEDLHKQFSFWKDVFFYADIPVKRVLVNYLVEKIYVKKEEIVIRLKGNGNGLCLESRSRDDSGVPE